MSSINSLVTKYNTCQIIKNTPPKYKGRESVGHFENYEKTFVDLKWGTN
jgi:hypothetical protein